MDLSKPTDDQPEHAPHNEPPAPYVPLFAPKTYLVEGILVSVFCCPPFGFIALANAVLVTNRLAAGEYAAAENASLEARTWMRRGAIVGAILIALYLIFLLATLAMAPHKRVITSF